MSNIVDLGAPSASNNNTPQNSSQARLVQKLADRKFGNTPRTMNWDSSRAFTPGGICGYENSEGLGFIHFKKDGAVQLFRSGKNSQGLISQGAQVVAASVTSEIHTKTERKNESKGTYIQYDKARVEQNEKDFIVDATNYRGWVNYQGGHLIDHKFSAGSSHYSEQNYIPAHFFYNSPLKEYLVKGCDAYIEIPVYTSNPPKIGVKDQPLKSHPIPIGIIFVQIEQKKFKDIYYFPNNNFDYIGLKTKLGLTKNIAATIAPYFKLDKCFHQLLSPVIITSLKKVKDGESKQTEREEEFFELIQDVSVGLSSAYYSQDQEMISQLSFQVLNTKKVNPFLCLDCSPEQFEVINDESLQLPFNALGDYLIRYGMSNALKSEVLSINSRFVFLNFLIKFIECSSIVKPEAWEFVDSLADQFRTTLDELDRIADTMDLEDLLFLADIYNRLSNPENYGLLLDGRKIYRNWETTIQFSAFINDVPVLQTIDADNELYYFKLFTILKKITPQIKDFSPENADHFLDILQEAQETLEFLLDEGYNPKYLSEPGMFLKGLRKVALKLLLVELPLMTDSDTIIDDLKFIESKLERLGEPY